MEFKDFSTTPPKIQGLFKTVWALSVPPETYFSKAPWYGHLNPLKWDHKGVKANDTASVRSGDLVEK